MAKTLRLLTAKNRGHPWDQPISSIERAMLRHGVASTFNDADPVRLAARVVNRTGLLKSGPHLLRFAYFAPLMGPTFFRLFPHCFLAETVTYAFDCWPPQYAAWERAFRNLRTRIAFFSAEQSAQEMGRLVPGLEPIWMPEAIDISEYERGAPLGNRRIDLLELGRKWTGYHETIRSHCERRGYSHFFQPDSRTLIFPGHAALRRGLAEAKILICFPSSLTHPERSGGVETMTLRYLEGMASGCLLIGRCPKELEKLFGYNPVVEVDEGDPIGQLDELLGAVHEYQVRVDRNYERLLAVGTWDTRVRSILNNLEARGYAFSPCD